MPEFFFHIKDGQITNPRVVRRYFDELVDGSYKCKIDKGRKRSLMQNAYYHGVVVPLVREGLVNNGFREVKTNEDAHEVMKALFLKRKIKNEESGDIIEINGSTQKLTTVEFMTYLEEIAQWAASYLGITIPQPNEQLNFYNEISENTK